MQMVTPQCCGVLTEHLLSLEGLQMAMKCPVCDEPVQGSGIRVKVLGKEVAVCCDSCARIIKANPERYARYISVKTR